MIAVIADDFTGAAEIGGVGIRNGFDVVIDTKVGDCTTADILIIATDTRSLAPDAAAESIEKITAELLELGPELIYKKIDSVLRGNVVAELMAQLHVSDKDRALLIPANPHLRRTIRDGIYYYNESPLNAGDFSNKAAAETSGSAHVLDLISMEARHVTSVISTNELLTDTGLMIGNTLDASDLKAWAEKVDNKTLPAGGSGFFNAILKAKTDDRSDTQEPLTLGKKIIYVCGSAFGRSTELVRKAKDSGQPVVYMPGDVIRKEGLNVNSLRDWKAQVGVCLEKVDRAIVAVSIIEDTDIEDLSLHIRNAMAEVIFEILKESQVDELFVEGGATAFSIVRKLGYTKFFPTHELGPGTIRMRVNEAPGLYLTLKPGSYAWPETIWQYGS